MPANDVTNTINVFVKKTTNDELFSNLLTCVETRSCMSSIREDLGFECQTKVKEIRLHA